MSDSLQLNNTSLSEERPTHYYVVSDSTGFVGAFYSASLAAAEVHKYNLVPFLVQQFIVAPGPFTSIWVVLYRDLDAVAFVSNSRDEAEKVQKIYGSVGLTYTDSIDYWEHPANKVSKAAVKRLQSLNKAHMEFVIPASPEELKAYEMEDCERLDRLNYQSATGPLARIIWENEQITIINHVIPISIGGTHDEK